MAENELLDPSTVPPEPKLVGDEGGMNGGNNDDPMPDAPNPTKASDSESDSNSDSDSEDEVQLNLDIQTLETELAGNPSNYDAHVQYIRALRKVGDIEKLRQAREAMSALFPLSPELWREWARDETTMNSGAEAFPAIEKLYERGVSDYLSVDLWCDYLTFCLEHNPLEYTADGISKIRNLSGSILGAWKGHIAMEIAAGYLKEAGSLYKRCYSKKFSGLSESLAPWKTLMLLCKRRPHVLQSCRCSGFSKKKTRGIQADEGCR